MGSIPGWYLLNQTSSGFKMHVKKQALAVMQTGQFDGVFLDHYWPLQDTVYGSYTQNDLQTIINDPQTPAFPPNANTLIVVNANQNILPSGIISKVNGVFMESGQMGDWMAVKTALIYNETYPNARQPRVNVLETTGPRTDLFRMPGTT